MNGALSLFPDPDAEPDCLYPQLAGTTGYRNGCRCQRCRSEKAGYLSNLCANEQCENRRDKGSRLCASCRAERNANRHRALFSRDYGLRDYADCVLCGTRFGWYESQLADRRADVTELYRRACDRCRRPYLSVIHKHRLNASQALRFLAAEHCDCCGKPFATNPNNGRKLVAIDHDHRCCDGPASCGRCVRGYVHPRCNTRVGAVEGSPNEVPLAVVLDYLRRYSDTEPPEHGDHGEHPDLH